MDINDIRRVRWWHAIGLAVEISDCFKSIFHKCALGVLLSSNIIAVCTVCTAHSKINTNLILSLHSRLSTNTDKNPRTNNRENLLKMANNRGIHIRQISRILSNNCMHYSRCFSLLYYTRKSMEQKRIIFIFTFFRRMLNFSRKIEEAEEY